MNITKLQREKIDKKIIYIDMDNVLVDFPSAFEHFDSDILKEYKNKEDEIPTIFGKMKPLPNAIEAYNLLDKYFQVYILSTSPWDNPTALPDKLSWIRTHLPSAFKNVIFSHNKHLNLGDYLIDDRDKNGAAEFTGEHIYFKHESGPKNWQETIDYIFEKEGISDGLQLQPEKHLNSIK
ncbi:5' nucleotidase, NT5C type [Mesoflavibacter zeaxanthinifaciens]|uniref:5' nucleotidase, NT5C type n=1 Tax=Mesoflavibacter zeaxanthinifaciens TaxID=393060 RepID=UPI003A8EC228